MKIGLELNAAELKQTLLNGVLLGLAEACLGLGEQGGQAPAPAQIAVPTLIPAPATAQPAAVQPTPTPAAPPVAPIPAPAMAQPIAPIPTPVMQPVAPPVAAVPTTAPTYTVSDLAMAGTQLVDAGRRQDVLDLLQAFGCSALTELPAEQYGAYAQRLRDMGAKL